jgi:hypothetical protein
MNKLWEIANEVEGLSYQLSNLTHVLELIATDIPDPQSGATWAARSMVETLSEKLEAQAENILSVYRETVIAEQTKKPKKK